MNFTKKTNHNYLKAGLFLAFLAGSNMTYAQEAIKYQLPPQSIVDLIDAPQIPVEQFSPDGKYMLILEAPGLQSIIQASQPVLGIAGLRINPINNTTVAESLGTFKGIKVRDLSTGMDFSLSGLPQDAQISDVKWSSKAGVFAFLNKSLQDTELWLADLNSKSVKKILTKVNDTYGTSYQWNSDGTALLVQQVSAYRGGVPVQNPVPTGPVVQENLGGITPSRTYQNLLANAYDESLMEYYLGSDLVQVDLQGQAKPLSINGIFKSVSYSPDGKYILTEKVVRPYSYLVPIYLFPAEVSVYSATGSKVKDIYTLPLADNLPISFDAVLEGPRNFEWRKDKDASLVFVEALDKGNPNASSEIRDELFELSAPYDLKNSKKIYSGTYRVRDIQWGESMAIVSENWRKDRSSKLTLINPKSNQVVRVLSTRKSEDTYSDPGSFIKNAKGQLLSDGKGSVFTQGQGASAEGDRPFVMKWNVENGKQDTLYKSKRGYYEEPIFFNNTGVLYVSRESAKEAPNVYSINIKNKKESKITDFKDPYPSIAQVQKTLLSYPRKDGLNLSGTLYVPADFKKGDAPLPVLVWAYPREFKTKEAAGQVKGSANKFPRLAFRSPVFWVTQGYAVVDQADMPIVGEGTAEPNDTFIEQIKDNASALIDHIVGLGVADRHRIGVGGHSYGAFMTANLLAHTDLFAAGIARSGAYNRTLTPFGFQGEARTYWQAKETYDAMSPFTYAPQIKRPILLTHGMDDENSGTFPIQSERLYAAIKGHGGIVRLVMLPKEFHGYRSREGVLHTFWEQHQWLEKYVKNRKKDD
ncbi:alpha/beta hydrolase family protein [Sphingobacterium cellulitidis]|uniref:alpha/beta hydrolase family protein n=1 Tax=Sphingobacterium cellulitidis TaxID=1768011 RepID=UPI003C799135